MSMVIPTALNVQPASAPPSRLVESIAGAGACPSLAQISEAVCSVLALSPSELVAPTRGTRAVIARWIYTYIAFRRTRCSGPEIAGHLYGAPVGRSSLVTGAGRIRDCLGVSVYALAGGRICREPTTSDLASVCVGDIVARVEAGLGLPPEGKA